MKCVGLELNHSKCEIISNDPVATGEFLCAVPGLQVVKPESATLLGSPTHRWWSGGS